MSRILDKPVFDPNPSHDYTLRNQSLAAWMAALAARFGPLHAAFNLSDPSDQ